MACSLTGRPRTPVRGLPGCLRAGEGRGGGQEGCWVGAVHTETPWGSDRGGDSLASKRRHGRPRCPGQESPAAFHGSTASPRATDQCTVLAGAPRDAGVSHPPQAGGPQAASPGLSGGGAVDMPGTEPRATGSQGSRCPEVVQARPRPLASGVRLDRAGALPPKRRPGRSTSLVWGRGAGQGTAGSLEVVVALRKCPPDCGSAHLPGVPADGRRLCCCARARRVL